MKIAVLAGGQSSERAVSLESGKGVLKALLNQGYEAFAVDVSYPISGTVRLLEEQKPDIVFNALHGQFGEDGCVQGLLNMMRIPYTHSGVLASALSMDKQRAKVLAASLGADVPSGKIVTKQDVVMGGVIPKPYVIKPNNEGSSVGVYIIRSETDERKLLSEWPFEKPVLMEEYIDGRELSVVVLDDGPVGIVEIKPGEGFYDYQAKYTQGAAVHEIPAQISPEWTKRLMATAYKIHQAFGCKGVSRSDFRLDEKKGRGVFLELNANPGMTPLSLVPEVIAKVRGVGYEELVDRLIQSASYEK